MGIRGQIVKAIVEECWKHPKMVESTAYVSRDIFKPNR